ncbi:hypothetical protein L6452_04747 [Arctium lappa]|uniref:Uncharacterized protein n=1 Tax=Arctium lappa TaxID=4217 RepID=A0ACB9EF66_ARCLA|nr:hypothetical protein L6452_04747 [Arctium lappa]
MTSNCFKTRASNRESDGSLASEEEARPFFFQIAIPSKFSSEIDIKKVNPPNSSIQNPPESEPPRLSPSGICNVVVLPSYLSPGGRCATIHSLILINKTRPLG